eukprot:1921351-Pyramimonas_sp.AAC.1
MRRQSDQSKDGQTQGRWQSRELRLAVELRIADLLVLLLAALPVPLPSPARGGGEAEERANACFTSSLIVIPASSYMHPTSQDDT